MYGLDTETMYNQINRLAQINYIQNRSAVKGGHMSPTIIRTVGGQVKGRGSRVAAPGEALTWKEAEVGDS